MLHRPSFTSSPRSTPARADVDHLVAAGREVLADVVGPDRQLPVAAVDHHGELHGPQPPVGVEGVEGGSDRAPGEEDVVDEHHDRPVEVDRDVGDGLRAGRGGCRCRRGSRATSRVPTGGVGAVDLGQGLGEGLGHQHAAGLQPDEDHVVEAVVALDDLVGHPPDGPADVVGVHDLGPGNENAPVRGRGASFAFGQAGVLPVRAGLTGPASRSGAEGSTPVEGEGPQPVGVLLAHRPEPGRSSDAGGRRVVGVAAGDHRVDASARRRPTRRRGRRPGWRGPVPAGGRPPTTRSRRSGDAGRRPTGRPRPRWRRRRPPRGRGTGPWPAGRRRPEIHRAAASASWRSGTPVQRAISGSAQAATRTGASSIVQGRRWRSPSLQRRVRERERVRRDAHRTKPCERSRARRSSTSVKSSADIPSARAPRTFSMVSSTNRHRSGDASAAAAAAS